jgi:hypothetical protein
MANPNRNTRNVAEISRLEDRTIAYAAGTAQASTIATVPAITIVAVAVMMMPRGAAA